MSDFIEGSVVNVMKKLVRENVYGRDEVDEGVWTHERDHKWHVKLVQLH